MSFFSPAQGTSRARTFGRGGSALLLATSLGLTAAGALGTVSAQAATPAVSTFSAGTSTIYTVPDGVTSVHVRAVGGTGGRERRNLSPKGGLGAAVETDLAVTPGQTLYVNVGTNGGAAPDVGGPLGSQRIGGTNGGGNGYQDSDLPGGGGGGATDIRLTADDLNSRVVVAAGGGGGNFYNRGGDAGQPGFNYLRTAVAVGAQPGSQDAGGAAGIDDYGRGTAGSFGRGGDGGYGYNLSGGGGGGGWYGGGGGAPYGSGAGGSNHTSSAASNVIEGLDTTATPTLQISHAVADTTPPVITSQVTPTAPDGANGWYISGSPNVSWDAADPESAISSQSCESGPVGTDGLHTFTCEATSAGGTSRGSITIKRDTTAPTVSFNASGLTDGGSYTWGTTPAVPTCSASDATSGIDQAGCTVSGYDSTVGVHTLSATATDNAGNTTKVTRRYSVAPWTTSGFYAPVDMGGVVNTVKGGSTVPVKFKVAAGSTPVTDPAKVGTLVASKVTCSTGAPTDSVEVTTTDATSLRYDATAGQFVYNWKTPKTPGTCYQLTLTTADGSKTNALFNLK